jgi:hypothetical protein
MIATFADKPVTYRSKNGSGEEFKLTIPFIESSNKAAAIRINTFLHDQLLHTLPSNVADQENDSRVILLDPPLEEMRSEGVAEMNSGRSIVVQTFISGCGAYCTESTATYNFDARNGRLIVSQELISPAGRIALAKEVLKFGAARLKKEIVRLEKEIKSNKAKKERSTEDLRTQLEIYESCLEDRFTKDGGLYPYYLKDPGVVTIGNGSLSFSHGECSDHASRALDDLGDIVYTVSGPSLRPYLSAYGKYIMLGEGDGVVMTINPYAQYFKGTINGKTSVTLYLGGYPAGSDESIYETAHYYYDKYRTKIHLSIKRIGNQFELTESKSNQDPKPVLRFQLKGDRLKGQWIGNGKTLPFEAYPL